ncbi:hypothetical protein HRG_014924 [Hirsutella rhossiliensis]
MAKKFHIEDDDQILGVPQIPITTEELKPYEKTATRDEVHQYLSLIGSILHPAIHTRPDEGTNELWCDNLQTIRLLTELSAKLKTNLKHIDIHRHWLRQEVQEERLQITWIKSTENPADGMTKALPQQKHEAFVKQLGMQGDRWHQLKPMRRRTVSTVSPPREI